eukprot:GHVS01026810.1.p1 GENE.GHVS01026810.1~~GHVS01026810.1.p1  ORF type:complete len:167 (-),score=50.16 GHVS01026810.1:343-843(-)
MDSFLPVIPCLCHPTRPVIVWATGRYLFALNYRESTWEAWRAGAHVDAIRSLQYDAGVWVTCGDDKRICVLQDKTFATIQMSETARKFCCVLFDPSNNSILVADKFGGVYSIPSGHTAQPQQQQETQQQQEAQQQQETQQQPQQQQPQPQHQQQQQPQQPQPQQLH